MAVNPLKTKHKRLRDALGVVKYTSNQTGVVGHGLPLWLLFRKGCCRRRGRLVRRRPRPTAPALPGIAQLPFGGFHISVFGVQRRPVAGCSR